MRNALLPLIVGILALPSALAQEPIVTKKNLDVSALGRLPVQEGGRYKPFDSLAREWMERISGKQKFRGTNPILLWLHLRYETDTAKNARIIKLPKFETAQAVGYSPASAAEDHVSFQMLNENEKFRGLAMTALRKGEKERSRQDLEIIDLHQRYAMVGLITGILGDAGFRSESEPALNGYFPIVPPKEAPEKGEAFDWLHTAQLAPGSKGSSWTASESAPMIAAMLSLRSSFRDDKGQEFEAASKALLAAQDALGYHSKTSGFPGMGLMDREVSLNSLQPFQWAFGFYTLALLCSLFAVTWRKSKVLWVLTCLILIAGLGIHGYGLIERTLISGRAMIGNFFESVIFVAAASAFTGMIFECIFKNRFFFLGASGLAMGLTWTATRNPDFFQPKISNLQPVLINNDWIHIHVPTIMTSYAILGLAAVLGHIWLLFYVFRGSNTDSQKNLLKTMFWTVPVGEVLLIAGIVLGGVWADDSWGRFWGWDPKEVGALILWLVFMVVIHGRLAGWLKEFGTAMGCLVGGLFLAWSYYGTNFFWTGLHSYAGANGDAKIPMWMWIYSGIDLTVILAATIAWMRRRSNEPSLPASSVESPSIKSLGAPTKA